MRPIDKPTVAIVAILALVAAAMVVNRLIEDSTGVRVDVALPALSPIAVEGERLFADNCAQCHGPNGSGSDRGPPLVHAIYNPGHHADPSFLLAVQRGVPQHHWNFGAMPPQPQVSADEVEKIVRFVREVQAANGIVDEEHEM